MCVLMTVGTMVIYWTVRGDLDHPSGSTWRAR
jgi:hypothetical protein